MVEALVPSNWTLPEVTNGSITFKEVIIEPVKEIESLLVLEPVNNTIIFTGGEESFDLIGSELELKISLVNLWGQTTVYQQIIHTIGCPIVADNAVAL